ncbi:hypothetical protein D9757_011466 [Collybiopsis confluens]|uniref:Peptidase A1 domain-containing protein n=1 Tax=Collybiopsis confluens TaxID=2823264 RepID=A0A8H5GJT3_9AGAR|nr:hypothetical protein D9757_011466 [Collybiopsis confluens]
MFATAFLFTLALAVAANPIVVVDRSPISLPLSRVRNFTSGYDIISHDLARIQHFKDRANARATNQPFTKRQAQPVINEVVSYIASVGVGASNSQYQLIVDTGSSNTWVGASKSFASTSTSTNTGAQVSVSYGSGEFSGTEWTDKVTLSSSLVVTQQSIGVASSSSGFSGTDGILGIGPTDLTADTVNGASTVPTVVDNLFSQGTISQKVIGISFAPTTTDEVTNGEIFFGGTDSAKFAGSVAYTPRVGDYWGIAQTVTYGSTTVLNNLQGIVDTGTTLIYLTPNSFNSYIKATGAVFDDDTGLYKLTTAQFSALKNLNFVIGGVAYSLTPNAQIFPRSLNTEIGGSASSIYLIVSDLGESLCAAEAGFDFINGYAFLERFYSVYDTTNNRVGFASTPFTTATTN